MKKILVINTKYREFGGEDSNIEEEVKFLSNFYNVQYLEYDNSEKINIYDFLYFQRFFFKNRENIHSFYFFEYISPPFIPGMCQNLSI